jgi:hypothetical protein
VSHPPFSYPPLGYPDDGEGDGYRPPVFGPPPPPPAEAQPEPPPPSPDRTALRALLILGVVVVVVLLGFGGWVGHRWASQLTEPDPPPAGALPAPTAAPPAASPTCPPAAAGPQTPAGWQPVAGPVGLYYDVPPDWTVNSCDTRLGWERACSEGPFGACPIQILSGTAHLDDAACTESRRGVAGVDGSRRSSDLGLVMRQVSAAIVDIYTSSTGAVPDVALGGARPASVAGAAALQQTATVTGITGDPCGVTTALHGVVATRVPGREGAVVFVISLEQGHPGAPDPRLLDRIVATLRS